MMRSGLDSRMVATAVTLWPQRDSSRALDRRKLRVLSCLRHRNSVLQLDEAATRMLQRRLD
jgi:hypothetical protein